MEEHIIELSHFDAFFHIFAAANLAYAGSKVFKTEIDDNVLKSLGDFETTYNDLKSKIITTKTNLELDNLDPEVREKIKVLTDGYETVTAGYASKLEGLMSNFNNQILFTNGIKSMFFISSLYCFAIMLLAGYQQYFAQSNTLNHILSILNFVIFYIIFVFCRTFTKWRRRPIKYYWPLSYILLLVLIFCCYCSYCDAPYFISKYLTLKTQIGVGVFIAVSPYLMHIFKMLVIGWHFNHNRDVIQIKVAVKVVSEMLRK